MVHRILILLLICLWSARADASESASFAVAGGSAVHLAPELSHHEIFLIEAKLGKLRLYFNTDTADVSWSGIRVTDTTTVRVGIAGEAFIAGVLTDYYARGELVPGRGFNASWVGPYAAVESRLGRRGFLGWRTAARRWWFGGDTARTFTPPEDFTSLEQRVSLTYWDFENDPSLYEAHRLFRRLRGVGVGIQGEFWWRDKASDWGSALDGRNDAQRRNLSTSQWAAAGVPLGAARLQLEERLYLGTTEDDLNRATVGGLNPYTIRVAGLGWTAYRSSRVLAGRASVHTPIGGDSELGFAVDAALLQDPLRVGSDDLGAAGGASAFVDLRFGRWQADLHVGWAIDTPYLARAPQLGAFAAIGRSL